VLSALAAAVVAIVFQPLRSRARRFADRVVYGKRATPYEVMANFGDQLAGTYSADDVLTRTARVLGEGVGAERARVWLSIDGDPREVAAWPNDAPDREDDFTTEVRHQGEVLGALSVAMPSNDPMTPSKEKLVRDLAAQAGLVLRNERLTSALKARLADLQAAQKRLVAAQDHERRKLERNIHDGAQQQLVALQVRQRLAEQLIDRDPAKAKEMLGQIQTDTGTALDDLRDLARGIYPPLLADKGLIAALESQARKATMPVRIDAHDLGRFPQDVEAAVYFCTLEALQNTAKYAHASRVTVRLSRANGSLAFTVADDGTGFDTGAIGHGTGLQGIADRLGALDGEFEVASAPGSGTTVTGRVPVGVGARDDTEEGA
jgi:signal transduction histidine kinase